MNKILRLCTVALASCCFVHSYAQREIKFSYCNDSLSNFSEMVQNQQESGSLRFGAAILIPGSRLKALIGQKITHVRFRCTSGISGISVWARNSLKDYVIGAPTRVNKSVAGWNDVTLNTPIDITGDDLYIGYNGTAEPGAGVVCDGTVNANGTFFYDGNQWRDLSTEQYPPFCIQAFAQADNDAPLVDLATEKVTFDNAYTKMGDTAKGTINVGNYGVDPVAAPKLYYSVGGGQPVEVSVSGTIKPNNTQQYSFEVPTKDLAEGKIPLRAWISTDDIYKGNDSIDTNLLIYSTSFPHKVLVEHFTTLKCVNCPDGHKALSALLSGRKDYVWVAHHIGYQQDELTQSESYGLQAFGATSAPLAMFDRRALSSSKSASQPTMYISYSGGVQASLKYIQPDFEKCASTPAFVSVNIENNYDPATRTLSTTVSGTRNAIFSEFYDQANLTVELVEDHVQTNASQTGSGEKVHNNVFRTALTRIDGDEINWNGDTYTETYTTTLPDSWKSNNVRVVAFVNLPFSSNETEHADVLNAAQLNINYATGINNVEAGAAQVLDRACYNLQGQRISQPTTNGAYIERIVTPQGVRISKRIK